MFRWREVDETDAVRLPKSTAAPPISRRSPRHDRPSCCPLRRAATLRREPRRRAPPPLRCHRSEDDELRAAGEVSSAASRRAVPCRAASRRAARCGGGSRVRGVPPPLPVPAAASSQLACGALGLAGRPGCFFIFLLINYKLFICYLFIID